MRLIKTNNNLFPAISTIFDDFFDNNFIERFNDFGYDRTGRHLPAINIKEHSKNYVVEVVAPGLVKDDFKIEIEDDMLTISAEKQEKSEDKKEGKYTKQEFKSYSFKRALYLQHDFVDVEKIDAKYKEGILYLTIPKKEKAIKKTSRTVQIS